MSLNLLLFVQMPPPAKSRACQMAVKVTILIPFSTIENRQVAEHINLMCTAKIFSVILLTMKELCLLLVRQGRQGKMQLLSWQHPWCDLEQCENSTSQLAQWFLRAAGRWSERQRIRESKSKVRTKLKQAWNFKEESTIIPAIKLAKCARISGDPGNNSLKEFHLDYCS